MWGILLASTLASVFQPAFHQALRWSESTSRTTYRVKVPVGRGGSQLRISFRAGDGALTLYRASVALAGEGGSLASVPMALTFSGASGASLSTRQRLTSDPVNFSVEAGDELAISYDVQGALAASAIYEFPDSYVAPGANPMTQGALGGSLYTKASGLDGVDVWGPKTRAFIALGDSITEGYVDGGPGPDRPDDIRNAWPLVAQRLLGIPFVDAAVSGQGVADDLPYLGAEVFPVQGVTDCIVLLGTNDLAGVSADQIENKLSQLFSRLRPFCRVWAATLLPKNRTSVGDYATVLQRRADVNAWIRAQPAVNGVDGMVDFEAVLRASDADPAHFLAGMTSDGIHPSIEGQQKLGNEVARYFAPPTAAGLGPASGEPAGGQQVKITGSGFGPQTTVLFDDTPASVQLAADGSLIATTPAHSPGLVDVHIQNPNGAEAVLSAGFNYLGSLRVAAVTPNRGSTRGGTLLTLSGEGFEPGASVLVDGIPAQGVQVVNDNTATASLPSHGEGTVSIEIKNPDGEVAELSQVFTYSSSLRPSDTATVVGGVSTGLPRASCGSTGPSAFSLAALAWVFSWGFLRRRRETSFGRAMAVTQKE